MGEGPDSRKSNKQTAGGTTMHTPRPWPDWADEHLAEQFQLQRLSWEESFVRGATPKWTPALVADGLGCSPETAGHVLRSLEVKTLLERVDAGTWRPNALTLQLAETGIRTEHRPELAKVRDTRDRILALVEDPWKGYMMMYSTRMEELEAQGIPRAVAEPHIEVLRREGAIEVAPEPPYWPDALVPAGDGFRQVAGAAAARVEARGRLDAVRELEPPQRGREFEMLVAVLFSSHCSDVMPNVVTPGEQHDLIARVDGDWYVVECRWTAERYGNADRDQLAMKAQRRGLDALVLSMGGVTADAVGRSNQEKHAGVVLLAGRQETEDLMSGMCTIRELVRHKRKRILAEGMDAEEAVPPIYTDSREWFLAPYWEVPM